MDWQPFVQTGQRVAVLPARNRPRLVILADGVRGRWRGSALYPASRLRARFFRLALRVKAALWPSLAYPERVDEAHPPLGDLLDRFLPNTWAAAVLLGTPGPAEKVTVELWNHRLDVVGYLKYGERQAARRRLRREWSLLRSLPPGVGPKPLALFPWHAGLALLTTPLEGRPVPARLPPSDSIVDFCHRLEEGEAIGLQRHPWIQEMESREVVREVLGVLDGRRWPVAFQHGDLASWNLRVNGKHVSAFDWEYGTRYGFPGLDLAYYFLQIGALIYNWKPVEAQRRASAFLRDRGGGLNIDQARALVRLAAFDAYLKAEQDGHPAHTPIQLWREQIWKR